MAAHERAQPHPCPAQVTELPLGAKRGRSARRRNAPGRRGDRSRILLKAGIGLVALGMGAAHAQSPSPNQPMAIQGLPPEPCPLVVPRSDYALQPLRIKPSQVAAKNAMGCLSPADAAVYGPDGCPVKLCKAPQGTMPLPQL